MKTKITQEEIMQLLDKLYIQSISGVSKMAVPVEALADNYISKSKSVESAAKSFIRFQLAKCTTSGFLSGLGGILSLIHI